MDRCKICGKEFSLKQHVRRHMLSHISQDYDRENSYLCSTCGRSFTKLSDIALHMGTHIDDVLAKDQVIIFPSALSSFSWKSTFG